MPQAKQTQATTPSYASRWRKTNKSGGSIKKCLQIQDFYFYFPPANGKESVVTVSFHIQGTLYIVLHHCSMRIQLWQPY
jgi:hypothetical protein